MKYFIIGYMSAVITMAMISCTVTPLEANSVSCGDSIYNPCYVKLVD